MTNGNAYLIKLLVYLLPVNPSCIHAIFEVESFVQTKLNVTAWKESKYGVISGSYFPVFGLNTEKYGSEITLHSCKGFPAASF